MIKDRNKTVITRTVTSAAVRYLEERGCKPLETEVPVCEGWVADIGAVLLPTITELVGLKLIKRRPKWDDEEGYREWWGAAKKIQGPMTILVEVKTSLGDFRGDKKWSLPVPVNIAYVAIPKDLDIRIEEVPVAWGLLEYGTASDCVRLARAPVIQSVNIERQFEVVLEIAIRRDHHTRYKRMREFRRGLAITQNAEVSRTRTLDAMRAMISVVKGLHGSLEGALEWHGIKQIPSYDLVELRKLWNCADSASRRAQYPGRDAADVV